jgi:hypothetical protein
MAVTIWKPDTKSVWKMTVRISDGSVFGGLLYSSTYPIEFTLPKIKYVPFENRTGIQMASENRSRFQMVGPFENQTKKGWFKDVSVIHMSGFRSLLYFHSLQHNFFFHSALLILCKQLKKMLNLCKQMCLRLTL